jgi:hypothetical protein
MAGIEAGVGFGGQLSFKLVPSAIKIAVGPVPVLQCSIVLFEGQLLIKIQVPGDL